jgi:hypothetical protein
MCVLSNNERGARAGCDRHSCVLSCPVRQGETTASGKVIRRRPHVTNTDSTHTSRANDVIVWFKKTLQRSANENDDHIIT